MGSNLRSCPIQLSRRTDEPKCKNLEANVEFLGSAEAVAMTFRKKDVSAEAREKLYE